jgi:hypothetical protein
VGLAFAGAILLAALSITFTNKSEASNILPAAEKEQVAQVLGDDAEVMGDARLEEQLAGQPPDVQAEILRINDEARPQALQVALLVPLLASTVGFLPLIPDDAVTRSSSTNCRTGCGSWLSFGFPPRHSAWRIWPCT